MGRKPTGKPRGRPEKEIDAHSFEKLCGLQCTLSEIAGFFECCEDTIETWCKRTYSANFSDVYKRYAECGKISLRRNQFALSEKSATMAIWLGKQWLGQRDKDMTSLVRDNEMVVSMEIRDLTEDSGNED